MASLRPTTPDSDDEGRAQWYTNCCADLNGHRRVKTREGAMRATLTNAARLWDNGSTLTYTFVRPAGTKVQQDKVKTVVKEWERYANIKFRYTTSRDATIRISFDERDGSWSYVGKDILQIPKREATMNYGWVSTGRALTEEDRGVILHEFGHTLGYLHEHQNSRRGEKLTLDEQAVLDFYGRTQGWDEPTIRSQILDVYDDDEVSNFSSIDITSIMMYFMPPEMNLERITVPPNNALSVLDKAFAFLNYPFLPGNPVSSDASVNIDNALTVIGVDAEFKQTLLSEYQEGDWSGLRAEFTRWSLNEKVKAIGAKLKAKRSDDEATTKRADNVSNADSVVPTAPIAN